MNNCLKKYEVFYTLLSCHEVKSSKPMLLAITAV